jgi:hydrogenase-4 component B
MIELHLAVAALLLALGVVGAAARRRHGPGGGIVKAIVYGTSAAGCAVNLVALLWFLAGGGGVDRAVLPIGLPWLSAHFRLDGLSAFFLLIVNLLGCAASVYGIGYGTHEKEPWRVLPFFPVFLAGMNLVPLADDAFSFLVAWEFMSLSSWLLVLTSHESPDTRRAAYVYLVMAAFGTMAMLLAFGALAGVAGDYQFDAMRGRGLGAGAASLVLVFLLLGAGSKAGLVPLHVWLPLAHPAAPSHVSALMSGAMTKVAIYALIRVLFDLVGPVEWWWAMVVLTLATASAVLGVLAAVVQRDLKTLLAYSTVENVGLIVVAVGLAIAFKADGMRALAGLALGAALLHALNHALFKGLLFFGAGAVLVATGERDLERLGGLIHRLPRTATMFLIGAAAISALPPLNGFASEWLIFQAVLNGPVLPQWGLKLLTPVVGALLALAAALAAACFVRAFGIGFLGRPRSTAAAGAGEVDRFMLAAMAALAAGCVLLGAIPAVVLGLISPVTEALVGAPAIGPATTWNLLAPLADRAISYSPPVVIVAIVLIAALIAAAVRRMASHELRRTPAWDCGFPDARPATQYTASSFAQPIRRVYGSSVFRAREIVDMPDPADPRPARFAVEMRDLVWDLVYRPIGLAMNLATERLNKLQFLTIRRYLTLMFAALIVLLSIVALAR